MTIPSPWHGTWTAADGAWFALSADAIQLCDHNSENGWWTDITLKESTPTRLELSALKTTDDLYEEQVYLSVTLTGDPTTGRLDAELGGIGIGCAPFGNPSRGFHRAAGD